MKKQLKTTKKRCKSCNKVIKKNCYCSKCQKLKNPLRYSYQTLKDNAKRRGKTFELTYEEFCEFVIKTDYIARKGVKKDSYHIDRIKEEVGYTKGNLQILTNSQNIRKYLKYYWDGYKMNFEFKTYKNEHSTESNGDNGQPF